MASYLVNRYYNLDALTANLQHFSRTLYEHTPLRILACSHKTSSRVYSKQNAMETAHRRRDIARTNETNYANRIEQAQIELIHLRWNTLA